MDIREREVDVLKSSGYLKTYSMLTLTCIPFMVCFIKVFFQAELLLMLPVAVVAEWFKNVASQFHKNTVCDESGMRQRGYGLAFGDLCLKARNQIRIS